MEKENLLSNHQEHNTRLRGIAVVAAITSLLLIGSAFWNSYQGHLQSSYTINQSTYLNRLSSELRYYDEVLTMSAFVSATTGDLKWEERYNSFAKKLDDTIVAATIPATKSVLKNLADANNNLIQIEARLFDLIRNNNQNQATQLITSEEYLSLKAVYALHLEKLGLILQEQAQKAIRENNTRQRQTTFGLGIYMILLVVIWIYVIHIIKCWRQQLLRYNNELSQLVHYDPLTGAANRSLFKINLATAISYSRRHKKYSALLLLDLDNFKIINDTLGHPVGDKLLIAVANKLEESCRETDTVARLGGDEFAIIATDLEQENSVVIIAEKLLSVFRTPVEIEGQQIDAQASIGIAIFPDHGDSEEELLQKADIALYKAKDSGRNTAAFFDREIETLIRKRQQCQIDIQQGIERNEFELYYQPIFDLGSGKVSHAESLIRWHHPIQGFTPPSEFIPIAESSQLIIPLGEWVFREACRQQLDWKDRLETTISISINVSAVQFRDSSFYEFVKQTLTDVAINPRDITLEITESAIMYNNQHSMEQLLKLRGLGISLAVDDFGTGYSSLAYLKQFPISYLKIDRKFVSELPQDTEDTAITRAIINMGKALNYKIIAEGVETSEQLDFLKREYCEYAQGFFLGKPVSAHNFEDWYRKTKV